MNNLSLLSLLAVAGSISVVAQTLDPSQNGSSTTRLPDGAASLMQKTITPSFHKSGIEEGVKIGNVNTFTGQSNYQIPLGKVSVRGKIEFPIGLGYSGNTREIVRADNRTSPTEELGLGWNMPMPSVSRNTMGTFTFKDDVYYANLGPYGGGQLLANSAGKYYLMGNPYVDVSYTVPSNTQFKDQIVRWTFKFPDGVVYVFGDDQASGAYTNAQRVITYTSNGNSAPLHISPYQLSNSNLYIYKWDLRVIRDPENANQIWFDYAKTDATLFLSSFGYTRESYLSRIRYLDKQGVEVVSWQCIYGDKSASEWVGTPASVPDLTPTPIETKYLSHIDVYQTGIRSQGFDFYYHNVGSGAYTKRLLDSLVTSTRFSGESGTFIKTRPWKFSYNGASMFYMLTTVTEPSLSQIKFQYGNAPFGTHAQQPAYSSADVFKSPSGSDLTFPSGSWKNQSECDERFCYLMTANHDSQNGDSLYVNIWPHTGNYFNSSQSTRRAFSFGYDANGEAREPQILPYGDYYMTVDVTDHNVDMQQWDGIKWNQVSLPAFPDYGEGRLMSVYPSKDYFLVKNYTVENYYQQPTTITPVIKQGDSWVALNQGSTCDLDDQGDQGDEYRTESGCLEWNNSNVSISTAPSYFIVNHENTGVLFFYALNRTGTGFVDMTSQFVDPSDGSVDANHPNNWSNPIKEVRAMGDYFLVRSNNYYGYERVDVMHFDGMKIRQVASTGWQEVQDQRLDLELSEDYFLIANRFSGELAFWKKQTIDVPSGKGITFVKTVVRTDVPDQGFALQMKAYPQAFAVGFGYYTDYSRQEGFTPRWDEADGSQMASYLYQVDLSQTPGYRDRSTELSYTDPTYGTSRLVDLEISPTDNSLVGKLSRDPFNPTQGCAWGDGCDEHYASMKVRFLAGSGTPFLYAGKTFPEFAANYVPGAKKLAIGGRLAAVSVLNLDDSKMHFRLYNYDGDDYVGSPDSVYVVTKVTTTAGLDSARLDMGVNISYGSSLSEYNIFDFTPMFQQTEVSQVSSTGAVLGKIQFNYNLDYLGQKLTGKDLNLNGVLANTKVYNKANQLLSTSSSFYTPASKLSYLSVWPSQIAINRLDSTSLVSQRSNQSHQRTCKTFSQYNLVNGQPRFIKQREGDRWSVSERIFNSLGLTSQTISYDFPYSSSQPQGPAVETWASSTPFDHLNAIVSKKIGFSSAQPYLPEGGYIWRDRDPSLSDADLSSGKEPAFDLNRGWESNSAVMRRNAFTQILESNSIRDTSAGGDLYTSIFYEGKRSLPIATITNSKWDNCGVLGMEDGEVTTTSGYLDPEHRWQGLGGNFTTSFFHTGRYGFRVTDNWGVTSDLFLKDVKRDTLGYIVSAWIYTTSGTTPVLAVQCRRISDGVVQSTINGVPVDGAIVAGKWQRWEARVTNAQLVANNLFNPGTNDYIRVLIGTGAPASNASRIVYIDDMICMPDRASFAMSSYDYRGNASSMTDNWHSTYSPERDFAGTIVGARDDHFRILNQSAMHGIKENPSSKQSRSYSFGFENGNLISNWSFETMGATWDSLASDNTGFKVSPRYPGISVCSGCKAVTGTFVAKVSGNNNATSTQGRMYSTLIPILPAQAYTFSAMVRSSGVTGTTSHFAMRFYSDYGSTQVGSATGSAYGTYSSWTLYSKTFTAPANACFAKLAMVEATNNGDGGTFFFDDLVLEEGTLDNTAIQARRNRIGESINFTDALGRSTQAQIRIGINSDQTKKYLMSGNSLDGFGRPDTSILPVTLSAAQVDYVQDMVNQSKSFWTSGAGRPDAGGVPYSQAKYFDEPGERTMESGSPGSQWAVGTSHSQKGDFYFVNSLSIPSNIEAPATAPNDSIYNLSWVKGLDGNYSLIWVDIKGRMVQKASNLDRNGATPNLWKWSMIRYDYYQSGLVKRALTPLDVDNANAQFADVIAYNSAGKPIARTAPGRGLTKFWYNRSGQLRFSQDAGQRSANEWAYFDYDALDRPISKGIQTIPSGSLTQRIADVNSTSLWPKAEKSGCIYGSLGSFQTRTGLTLSSVLPEASSLTGKYSKDRLVCAYNRNADNTLPGFSASDKFVADFSDFDQRGNIVLAMKTIGPVRDANKKRQKSVFSYNVANKLWNAKTYLSAPEATVSNDETFTFDALGRVQNVTGMAGKSLAVFAYNDWGNVKSVILGGNGSSTGTKLEYFYHVRGWINEIKATQLGTNKISFQQFLGYEGKARPASQVPNPAQTRFTGQITQQLYKFASDVNSAKPVRMFNYSYDELGRMSRAEYQENSNATPLNSDESINYGALTWSNSGNGDGYYDYDKNGRITGQRSGGVSSADSAKYGYQSGTYKLDKITGKLGPNNTRNMSASGNFVYNSRGAMTSDASKRLTIAYGWDLMPVKFSVDNGSGAITAQYQFYDAFGHRVARIETAKPVSGSETRTQSKSYVVMGGSSDKEWLETYNSTGGISSTAQVVNLFANALIGRIRKTGEYEFFLKDALGSTMRAVNDNGDYLAGNGSVIDYMAFGEQKKVKANADEPTQKYTGKEFEDISRLYYFGARFYDPEIGAWQVPDPAGQYRNPYGFGDPINSTDPDGKYRVRKGYKEDGEVIYFVEAMGLGSAYKGFMGNFEGPWAKYTVMGIQSLDSRYGKSAYAGSSPITGWGILKIFVGGLDEIQEAGQDKRLVDDGLLKPGTNLKTEEQLNELYNDVDQAGVKQVPLEDLKADAPVIIDQRDDNPNKPNPSDADKPKLPAFKPNLPNLDTWGTPKFNMGHFGRKFNSWAKEKANSSVNSWFSGSGDAPDNEEMSPVKKTDPVSKDEECMWSNWLGDGCDDGSDNSDGDGDADADKPLANNPNGGSGGISIPIGGSDKGSFNYDCRLDKNNAVCDPWFWFDHGSPSGPINPSY